MCELRPALLLALLAWMTASAAAMAASELPDPTRPPISHQAAVARLNLEHPQAFAVTAIKIAGMQRRAIVNERLVAVGDRVDDGLVVDIVPGAVVIEYLARRSRIGLLDGTVRRHARPPESTPR